MNDTENNKELTESEKLYNEGEKFLEVLRENGLTVLGYKELTEQERERADERMAKTLGISPEEMRSEYANQRA